MTYPNILRNPTLKTNDEVLQVEEIAVPGYPPQYIWHPTDWKTTVTPTMKGLYAKRMTDLQIIPTVWPQSVNGQRVLTIETNTKHFVVKLEQSSIALKANQRYLIKVLFTPAVQIVGEANPADLAWRIMINRGEIVLTDGFQNADAISEWGQPRSILMVIHLHAVQTVDLAVEFWSKFGNLDKQIYIHSVGMLEVEAMYGNGGNVHFLGTPQTEIPIPTPDPSPDPNPLPDDTPLPTAPGWVFALMLFVCACILGVVIYSSIAPHIQYVAMLEVNPVEELLNQLFAIPVFATVTYTSAIVYFLVEVWKRSRQRWFNNVKWLRWAEPENIAVLLIVVFLGLHGLATEYAYDNALKTIAQFVTDMIGALGPYVLGMIGTNAVVSISYDKLQAANVPGFTYKIRKREKPTQ